MLKRRGFILSVVVGAGAGAWLALTHGEASKNSPISRHVRRPTTKVQTQTDVTLHETAAGESKIPRSKRHMEGAVEKHQSSRAPVIELENAVRVLKDKINQQGQVLSLITQTRTLLKLQDEQLLPYAAGLDVPENKVKMAYPLYLEAQGALENLRKGGMGAAHPTVKAQTELVATLKGEVDEGMARFKTLLQTRLEATEGQLRKADGVGNASHDEASERGLDSPDFIRASGEHKMDQASLKEMELELERKKRLLDNGSR